MDAAVAAAFAAFAAEPLLAGAGGAGVLICALPDREPAVVDFFSPAPGREGVPSSLDFAAVEVDFGPTTQTFHVGRGSVAPPLALPGLLLAAERLGSLRPSVLLEPAVRLAREGVVLSREGATVYGLLWPIQERSPETLALAGGRPPAEGTRLINPGLGDLLEETGREGHAPARWREALLDGFGPDRGGLLTAADLDAAAPRIVAPRRVALGDWTLLTSPHVGGARVATILEGLAARPDGADEADDVLAIARASRRGHLGDVAGRGSTTHISVVDAAGGFAAVTLTNGEGCGHLAEGTGVQLNNFLGEEDLNPDGFHRHAPGAALPTMIAPSIALRHGTPTLALGSGGSNRIRSVVARAIDLATRGVPLRDLVLAPRVHAETDDVWVELEGLGDPDGSVRALEREFARVHPFPKRAFFFGGVHAVALADGPEAMADPRRGGAAA